MKKQWLDVVAVYMSRGTARTVLANQFQHEISPSRIKLKEGIVGLLDCEGAIETDHDHHQ